jgi:hypothetical protein
MTKVHAKLRWQAMSDLSRLLPETSIPRIKSLAALIVTDQRTDKTSDSSDSVRTAAADDSAQFQAQP